MITACLNDHSEKLENELTKLKNQNDSLTQLLNVPPERNNYWFNKKYQGEIFTERGIKNPNEFVEEYMRSRPELIPIEAVLGGTMHFAKIQLLSSSWVIADYDDGHILGRAIYEFKFLENNELEFKLIASIEGE